MGSSTANLRLYKPTPNSEQNWGANINSNFDIIESRFSQVINPTDAVYGLSTSASGAVNTAALNAAHVAANAAGKSVFVPSGSYAITGTVTTLVPMAGEGQGKTIFLPTTSVPAFDVTLNYGRLGGFSIDYTNVGQAGITANAIGLRLLHSNYAKFYDILCWHGYRVVQVLSSVGLGYIFQTEFDNIVSANNKDYAFYIDSSSDSTTLKFNCCHILGKKNFDPFWPVAQTFKGWYFNNVTSKILSNCSMDGGDGDVDGSVIYSNNGQNFKIDSFHLEDFTHSTGGANHSPFVFRDTDTMIDNLLLFNWTMAVGGVTDATLMRVGQGSSSFILGSVAELNTILTTGTKRYADITGCYSAQIMSKFLDASNFLYTSSSGNYVFAKDTFSNTSYIKQLGGSLGYVSVAQSAVAILNVPARGNGNDSGLFWCKGENGSTGVGWFDLIALNAAANGLTVIDVISSKDNGSVGARTYSWDNTGKNIKVLIASGTSNVISGGFAVISP